MLRVKFTTDFLPYQETFLLREQLRIVYEKFSIEYKCLKNCF